jgi:hypothetical protein
METTVKYLDEHGVNITEQQCSILEGYSKITYIDNVIKQKEEFGTSRRYGESRFVEYFMDRSENKSDILQSYADGKTACSLRLNGKSQNGFTQWDNEDYSIDGVLKWKGNQVYDSAQRLVMYRDLDASTEAFSRGAKILYVDWLSHESHESGDILARFYYDYSGNIIDIGDPGIRLGDGDAMTLDYFLMAAPDFLWEQHPYFHSLTPYLPDSSEI